MRNPPPVAPDPKLLTDLKAAKLLERASELDLARTAGTRVAELRAAATEAGISPESFDAALAELDAEGSVPVAAEPVAPKSPWKRVTLAGGLIGALFAGFLAVVFASYIVPNVPANSGPPMQQEALALGCIAPGDAAALVRPILNQPGNTIIASPANSPRVLTVVATAEQMREVKATLAQHDVVGSKACSAVPAR